MSNGERKVVGGVLAGAPCPTLVPSDDTYPDVEVRFAGRLAKSADKVGDAWQLALGRPPDADERAHAEDYLKRNSLERLCLLVFNMSEFLYVN